MEKSLAQLIPKSWLPTKNWEEISRQASENGVNFMLGHLNPEINMALELKKGAGEGKSISESESIAYHGISTGRGEGMKDFFEGMTKMAESGLAPGITVAGVESLKTQYHEAGCHEKYDLDNLCLTVAKFSDEKLAEAQLLSMQVIQTQGFTEMPVPGMEKTGIKNLGELLKSDYYKSMMKSSLSKEQLKQIEELTPKLEEVSKKIKTEYQKRKVETGAQYYQGKYLGFPALFLKVKNPKYEEYSAPQPVKSSGKTTEIGGGGGFDPYVTLPSQSKVKPSKYVEICLGLRVNNFVVSGSLLYMMSSFPPGNTFCHSLTKTQTKIETEKIEGKTYRTVHILPVNSTLAQEGYFNQEEVEKILNELFALLKE